MARYKIIEELGAGGMGQVYRAVQTNLGREVALKVLHRETEVSRQRFRREMEVLAGLEHPSVVRVFDSGELDGRLFYVMELLDAEPLVEFLRRGEALPAGRVLRILESMLDALELCHRQGIVHRDIKPHNIMIDRQGRTTLVDFGLVHIEAGTVLTRKGALPGTPRYLAPEVVRGDVAGPPADIYGLGLSAWELARGQRSFSDEGDLRELFRWILVGERSSLCGDVPEFPPDVDRLIARMMIREPADRPAAGELLAEVRALAARFPDASGTRRVGQGQRTRRMARPVDPPPPPPPPPGAGTSPTGESGRGRTGIAVLAAGVTLVMAAGALVWRTAPAPSGQPAVASAPSAPVAPPPASPAAWADILRQGEDLRGKIAACRRNVRSRERDMLAMMDRSRWSTNDPMVSSVMAVLGDLRDLLRSARARHLPGPDWMELATVGETAMHLARLTGAFDEEAILGRAVESIERELDEPPDPFARAAQQSIRLAAQDHRLRNFAIREKRATFLTRTSDDLAQADPAWAASPRGLEHRQRMLEDAAYLWQRTMYGLMEEKISDEPPELLETRRRHLELTPAILEAAPGWTGTPSLPLVAWKGVANALALARIPAADDALVTRAGAAVRDLAPYLDQARIPHPAAARRQALLGLESRLADRRLEVPGLDLATLVKRVGPPPRKPPAAPASPSAVPGPEAGVRGR